MLHKTRGIVLSTTEYGETSIVARIYTEVFGLQSYLVNSVRKKNAKIHANVFQSLTPVEMVVHHKERPGLQRISDIRPQPPLCSIPFDIVKTSLVLFLVEMIAKSIREEEANNEMFEFILASIINLDDAKEISPDFHLMFLIRLTRFLGFYPSNNYSEKNHVFDLRNGQFDISIPPHPHYLIEPYSKAFADAISKSFDVEIPLGITTDFRRKLVEAMVEFYQLHIDSFGNVKSLQVLEEIWK